MNKSKSPYLDVIKKYYKKKFRGLSTDQLKKKLHMLRRKLLKTEHQLREPIRHKIRDLERHLEINFMKCLYCKQEFEEDKLTTYGSFTCCIKCLEQHQEVRKEHFKS
ncbi:MAG: hypothetical protein GF353_21250 [Candidatus Lokiarchaeota archaeon]|nr:hypothetical protein [Candidatus Lokiarchaeota archaeon]